MAAEAETGQTGRAADGGRAGMAVADSEKELREMEAQYEKQFGDGSGED